MKQLQEVMSLLPMLATQSLVFWVELFLLFLSDDQLKTSWERLDAIALCI